LQKQQNGGKKKGRLIVALKLKQHSL